LDNFINEGSHSISPLGCYLYIRLIGGFNFSPLCVVLCEREGGVLL